MRASPAHLVRRFLGSLRPGGPAAVDREWVAAVLPAPQLAIWSSMSGPDRRHSVAVAREVDRRLGPETDPWVIAAALLHDSGKVVSGLHTPMRVVATIAGATVVRTSADARRWSQARGVRRRIGAYLLHPELGADALASVDADPLVVAWTREHHTSADRVTIDRSIADVLRSADDD